MPPAEPTHEFDSTSRSMPLGAISDPRGRRHGGFGVRRSTIGKSAASLCSSLGSAETSPWPSTIDAIVTMRGVTLTLSGRVHGHWAQSLA